MSAPSSLRTSGLRVIRTQPTVDPMQLDPPSEENDNNEEEMYEVNADDSFDLEAYANSYSGLGCVYRLIYVADHCPDLRMEALKLAITQVVETWNTNLYQLLHHKLQQCQGNVLPPDIAVASNVDVVATYSPNWVDNATQKAVLKFEKLEVELKNYKSNSIKESIRRGYNEIGDYYIISGDLIEATKSYSKARDYCTSSAHVISMCLSIVKVGVYLKNWSHVVNYILKAESTPDYSENSELQVTFSSTLKCMTGLAELAGRKYKLAAENFLTANLDRWESSDIMTPNNVAVYGGLCALATYNRSELQASIITNNSFKLFLELEPEIRDAIFKFYESKYDVCLMILEKIKRSLLLDMYIGPHVKQLYANIRSRAMIQYFTPYDNADLTRMAACFNTTVSELEDELVVLISEGHIKARIDSINKILYARHPDQRAETFDRALAMAEQYSKQMHILILKSQLIKHQNLARQLERDRANNGGLPVSLNIDFARLSS